MSRLREAVAAAALEAPQLQEDGSWRRRSVFAGDFPGFAGHFPGYPVLPAVVQVLAAQLLAEDVTGLRLRLQQIENAKFLLQLHPDEVIEVRCRERHAAGRTLWEASLHAAAGTAAQFQLQFGEVEAAC